MMGNRIDSGIETGNHVELGGEHQNRPRSVLADESATEL